MKKEQQSIPSQHEGKHMNLRAKSSFENDRTAKVFYDIAKARLLNAYEWYDVAKIPAATFTLTDQRGEEIIRKMRKGDILRIDIPGPGASSGNGYDWVRVEDIVEEETKEGEFCLITLRPTSNPEHDDDEIAHFFKSMATSTLLVKRENLDVIAEYHGRNELVNTDTSKYTDKIRNIVVGLAAKLGLSFSQWKSLINGLIEKPKDW